MGASHSLTAMAQSPHSAGSRTPVPVLPSHCAAFVYLVCPGAQRQPPESDRGDAHERGLAGGATSSPLSLDLVTLFMYRYILLYLYV